MVQKRAQVVVVCVRSNKKNRSEQEVEKGEGFVGMPASHVSKKWILLRIYKPSQLPPLGHHSSTSSSTSSSTTPRSTAAQRLSITPASHKMSPYNCPPNQRWSIAEKLLLLILKEQDPDMFWWEFTDRFNEFRVNQVGPRSKNSVRNSYRRLISKVPLLLRISLSNIYRRQRHYY